MGWQNDAMIGWYDRQFYNLTIGSNGLKNEACLTYLQSTNWRQLIKVWHLLVNTEKVSFQVAPKIVFEKAWDDDENT